MMFPQGFPFLVVILYGFASECSAEKCLNCNGVPTMSDCTTVTNCGPNEVCYARKLTQVTGVALFESGCISNDACTILKGIGRKRALTNCYECCSSGTSQEPCNRHLCGDHLSVAPGYTECYECSSTLKPENCKNIVQCSRDQKCYTHSYRHTNVIQNSTRYTLGCSAKTACVAYEYLAQHQANDQSTYYCNQCCDTDFCNLKLCGFNQLAKPVFTWKPDNRTVVPGVDQVTLICRTDPKSKANIDWTFVSETGSTATPGNVKISRVPHNVNVTFPVQNEDLGTWTCTATNSVGTSVATATIANAHAHG